MGNSMVCRIDRQQHVAVRRPGPRTRCFVCTSRSGPGTICRLCCGSIEPRLVISGIGKLTSDGDSSFNILSQIFLHRSACSQ